MSIPFREFRHFTQTREASSQDPFVHCAVFGLVFGGIVKYAPKHFRKVPCAGGVLRGKHGNGSAARRLEKVKGHPNCKVIVTKVLVTIPLQPGTLPLDFFMWSRSPRLAEGASCRSSPPPRQSKCSTPPPPDRKNFFIYHLGKSGISGRGFPCTYIVSKSG